MSTLATNVVTAMDIAKSRDPSGKTAAIAEVMDQVNEIVSDVHWEECNRGVSYQGNIRTGLPASTWRRYNEGVSAVKPAEAQVTMTCGMLEQRAEIDTDLLELEPNPRAYRARQARAHMEGLSQDFANAIIYENEAANLERITGLAQHYSTVSTATAQSANNVIDCGGTGSDNTSLWLIGWGPLSIFGIYPQGSAVGIRHWDKGEQTVVDALGVGGAKLDVVGDRWQWKCGLFVQDWRYGVRGCNIDVSNLVSQSSQADLLKTMIRMLARLPSRSNVRLAFYAARTVREMLDIQAYDKVNYSLTYQMVDGKQITSFQGVPIRTVDKLLLTEARVT